MSIVEHPAKAIYLANRNARMTRDQFRERWLTHSRVGEVLTGGPQPIAGLRYCLTVDPTDILPGASNEHDGVGLLALRSVVSIPTMHAVLTRNDVAFADELRTFERAVEDVTVYAASELELEGPETDVVVIEYARRREAIDAVEHLRAIERKPEDDALLEAGVRRWVRNVAVGAPARGFGYDAVTELWFDSLDQVADAAPVLQAFFDRRSAHTERRASFFMVTTVVNKLGRTRP
ncbi:MAG: hypothetical protein IT196_25360 [Acidimicrobiales bacterium]|nr:hypothetical protein [Acidimicrobiales bacterium]